MGVPEGVRPALCEGVERRDFGSYGVAAPPGAGSLLHLEPDEFGLLDLLDGSRTVDDLDRQAGGPVTELLDDLWAEGFLVDSPQPPAPRVAVTLHGIEFSGFDRAVKALNRFLGDAVFSRRGAMAMAGAAVAGLAAFTAQAVTGHRVTVSSTSPVLAVVVLRILGFVAVWLHESGHALVIVRNDRRVGRVGIGFYWGALTFYVDASHALFLPRRTRMLQSSAGVLTDLFLCGMASLVAWAGGDATWAVVLREFAILGYIGIILNAVPLLELDGYWFVADAMDRPTLHRDARRALLDTFRGRVADRRLAIYGLTSLTFGLALMVLGIGAWWHLFGGLFHRLWDGGSGYKALAVYLVLPYLAMIGHLAAQPFRYLRHRRARAASLLET